VATTQRGLKGRDVAPHAIEDATSHGISDMTSTSRKHEPPPEQTLPDNIEAEHVVLGYLMQGGAWREDIAAHDFAGEREQTVWHAMRAIHVARDEIDRQRLAVELGEKKLKRVGIGYLAELGEGCFREMRIEPYVAKLHDATARRDILHHTHILVTHLHSGDRTADELIGMAVDAFGGMQAGHGNGRFTYENVPSIWTWEANVNWVVEDLIPEAAITLITGDSGHGKTIFATALAGAIATGRPFIGLSTLKRRVIYCDRENPAAIVKQHLSDLKIEPTPDLIVWGNWCAQEADGPESRSLLKFAKEEKPVMIFDPAIAFHRGDEQSSTETRAFMQHCRNLLYRGSSDYKAAVDCAYLLEKLGDPAGPLSELRLVPFKNRFGGSTTLPLSFQAGVFHANQRRETTQEIMERLVRDNPGESSRSLIAMGRDAGLSKHQAEHQLSMGVKDGRFDIRKAGRSHGYYIREDRFEGI
jgi:hypothetical protein